MKCCITDHVVKGKEKKKKILRFLPFTYRKGCPDNEAGQLCYSSNEATDNGAEQGL